MCEQWGRVKSCEQTHICLLDLETENQRGGAPVG